MRILLYLQKSNSMRVFFVLIFFCFGLVSFSQNETLAKHYFDKGDFEKAMPIYKALHEKTPNRNDYFLSYVASLQQLEKFEEAKELLESRLTLTRNHPAFLIEMGRNYLFQNETEIAESFSGKL
jgi:tetratricopeptide (TPR) repeat protein